MKDILLMNINHLLEIDLNLLPALLVLLEERHVTNAAIRLGRTQSAISHTLRRLREVFHDELLVRSGNEMLLTPLAQELLPELRRSLEDLELQVRPRQALDLSMLERQFHVASTDMVELVVLQKLLPRLCQLAPGIRIHTTYAEHRPGESIEQRLRSGAFDLAWTVLCEDVSGLVAQRLYTEHFVCVVGRESPWYETTQPITLDDYVQARHVLISPRGGEGGFVDRALIELGLRRQIVWMTMSFLSAPLVTGMSDLVLTLPSRVAEGLLATGVDLKIVTPPLKLPTFPVVMAYHERFRKDAVHRWLRERVLELFEDS